MPGGPAISLTVVVVNNDGGGIFSFLPIAGARRVSRRSSGRRTGPISRRAASARRRPLQPRARRPPTLAAALEDSGRPGLRIIEARIVDRASNVEVHHALGAAVARALEEGGP